jgi:ABC-2 type transport system permease protein
MSTWSNIVTVARREFLVRIRTRSFAIGTALLVLGVVVIAMVPVIIQQLDRTDTTKVAVVAPEPALAARAEATIDSLLNAPAPGETQADHTPDFVVSIADDVAKARADAVAGRYDVVLAMERLSSGALDFTLYTNDPATGRTASLLRQAANSIAIGDRLDRMGIAPGDQASLFGPATFAVAWPDPTRTDPVQDSVAMAGQGLLGFGMTILIFMIIIMYGNWIAMSVVEEKSSRVMEVVLNAATPFQLLAGKVFGVGAVAFVQYAAVVIAGGAAILAQGSVASAVLGETGASISLPEGLTLGLLLAFGVYGVLGFLLYASLYAAAGSLVSRQEDVNAAVMPMTLASTGGYMIGVYAATGLLDPHSGPIVALAQVPFLSPFMMIARAASGEAQPWELALSIGLLVVAIGIAVWVAARIYAAGVLLYGQRPGARAVWRLLREGM